MGRHLTTNVLIGGVVYEAGTDEADIPEAHTVTADVWDGEANADDQPRGSYSTADVAKLREHYDVQLAERDKEITALRAEIDQLKSAPAAAPEASNVDYASFDLDELKAEIDRRNEGRADADRIGKRGSVETLVAALVADDAATTKG